MQKIPTLFLRTEDMRNVTREVNPVCQWVLDGEGAPTRKYDGVCVMFDGTSWWARREVKPGKVTPPNYVPISTDPITGKVVGWEPAEQSAFTKYINEAINYVESLGEDERDIPWTPGTFELIGPKINGNPEGKESHYLQRHSMAEILKYVPRDFDGLRDWLLAHPYEGIVWHHPDGRMAKLKKRDFPQV